MLRAVLSKDLVDLPSNHAPALDPDTSKGRGALVLIDQIEYTTVHQGLKLQPVSAVQDHLPGLGGSRWQSFAPIEHVDPEEMRILAVLLTGKYHRRMVIAVLGIDAHPDDVPLTHGSI